MNPEGVASVTAHYENHLAPVYTWMAGGVGPALARGEREVAALVAARGHGLHRVGTAVDLGAGFGMHAIPLARRGARVLAVDTSALLLAELEAHAVGLPVHTVVDDLLGFERHLEGPADLILCMGDTLTHLPDPGTVDALAVHVARALRPGGRFVATFRDYTAVRTGTARFIPVRSDADRILTCFLEYGPESVEVHDLLHERNGEGWRFSVSAYRKLRLWPEGVCAALRAAGLSARLEAADGGMVRAMATAGAP